MSDVALRVTNLGKQYRIGGRERCMGLREVLNAAVTAPFRNVASLLRSGRRNSRPRRAETIWALRDVSFDVKHGDVVGIVGRNGAGKSTLLKILSRITSPTAGQVEIHGRVGSLLEVGTGFHPELTGRENVFLNGAILGMKRHEIERQFDDIVAFAEVEKFIDTPVKHYSSGMYVRLAFAVAAHLQSEILLVDEVLAVGDAAFQKKCLGTMENVARQGRTVLFVSHNMNAINLLCSRAILLSEGRAIRDGAATDVVTDYLTGTHETSGERTWTDPQTAPGSDRVRLQAIRIVQNGRVTDDADIREEVCIEVEFLNLCHGARLSPSVHLLDSMGTVVLCSVNYPCANSAPDEWFGRPYPAGVYRTRCSIPGNLLNDGRYGISAFIRTAAFHPEAAALQAVWFSVHDIAELRQEFGRWGGVVRPHLAWRTELLEPLGDVSEGVVEAQP